MTQTKSLDDRYIKVGFVNTRYWELGNKGTTVILLHSAGASVEYWAYNIDKLAQYHQVYAVDLVGSGRSDKPPASYSLAYQAQFISDFMDALSIKHASLIGSSIGGGIALQFALMFPEKLDKLVLVNSLGLGKHIGIFTRLAALPLIDRLSCLIRPSRNSVAWVVKSAVYEPSVITNEWLERIYQLAVLPGAFDALLRLARTNLDLFGVRSEVFSPIVEQLSSITAPTLLIWGQQDEVLPIAHAYVAAKNLPNARLHIFDGCGHFPQIEHPEKFNQLVLESLA